MAALITASELTIASDDAVLLDRVSFEVPRGSIFSILGGSGCGKSTLMRTLIGLQPPVSGTVVIDGEVVLGLTVGHPRYGVMFQSGALLGSMTVGENLELPLAQWTDLPDEAIDVVVDATLGLVGLPDARDKLPDELSGGMRKRAAIARALVLEPRLLFLDEPSAGLDPVTSSELDELILGLNRMLGLTVVIVTHELESIFAIVHSCIMLDKDSRSIIARGDPRALRDGSTDPRVRAFFTRKSGESPAPRPSRLRLA